MTPRSYPREKPELIISTIRNAERIGAGTVRDTDQALGDLRIQLRALRARAAAHEQPPAWERVIEEANAELETAASPEDIRRAGRRLAQELQTLL